MTEKLIFQIIVQYQREVISRSFITFKIQIVLKPLEFLFKKMAQLARINIASNNLGATTKRVTMEILSLLRI